MHTFLQSVEWERFNQAMGFKTWRIQSALAIKVVARRGIFLHIPHVQFFSKELCDKLILLAKKEKCAFIRVSPLIPDSNENRLVFTKLDFRAAPLHMHPEFAWILNIDSDDEKLLLGMRKTTRYSIKKAERDGIKVAISSNYDDIDYFWKLYEQTAERQKFVPFSKKYIETEFRAFGDNAFLVLSKEAAAMIVLTEEEGFYHHGASTHHSTASYAVQWAAIKEARRRGKKYYNFWGVWDNPNSPQAGLSNFKRGFGGFKEAYVPARDLPLSKRYWFNYVIEKIRKLQRGF